ncbi:hypothetical protein [Aeromonas caviae]|uniref:hypothetical protein n=1 Tax=Aeromonas caviae TaxID=648 RepID=UPI001CC5BD39|nr:hypothetical protein [Aeromonas caviae]HDT5889313.1 hypothetical protein [Aeromonas dhakensis]HEB4980372.1 hypothetical protein [Aeromonas dhakensis]
MRDLDVILMVVIGIVTSVVLVRFSARRSMGVELTWGQSLKVVLWRGTVALVLGFGLGKLVGWGIQSGVLSMSAVKGNALLLVGVLGVCGLASFAVYQWIVHRITGRSITLKALAKGFVHELGHLVAMLAFLFALFLVVGLLYELVR